MRDPIITPARRGASEGRFTETRERSCGVRLDPEEAVRAVREAFGLPSHACVEINLPGVGTIDLEDARALMSARWSEAEATEGEIEIREPAPGGMAVDPSATLGRR